MTKAEKRAYMQRWRAKNPHYSRDYMRKERAGPKVNVVMILGVRCNPSFYGLGG